MSESDLYPGHHKLSCWHGKKYYLVTTENFMEGANEWYTVQL